MKVSFGKSIVLPLFQGNNLGNWDGFFHHKTQVFLQVVSQGCHHHVLVGLGHAATVNSSHIVVVNERTQNRFYCAAAPLDQPAMIGLVFRQFLVHLVIQRLVDTVFYLFKLGDFTTTFRSERTFSTVLFTTSVAFLLVTFTVG